MLKQFYKRRFYSLLTWGPIYVLFIDFSLEMGNAQGINLYSVLTSDVSMLLFFFPTFEIYSIYSIKFFLKKEIFVRFGSFQKAWKKFVLIILLDSIFFVFCFHASLFLCFCLKRETLFYFKFGLSFLPIFLLQCLTSFALDLMLMMASAASQNPLMGFLICYLVPWVEKAILVTHIDLYPFFFLAGMNLNPFSIEKWLFVLSEIVGVIISFLILIPACFSQRDYLKKEGG